MFLFHFALSPLSCRSLVDDMNMHKFLGPVFCTTIRLRTVVIAYNMSLLCRNNFTYYVFWLVMVFVGITSQFDSNGNIRDFLKIRKSVVDVLVGAGMVSSLPKLVRTGPPKVIHVLLDGQVVGSLSSDLVTKVVAYLRRLKVESPSVVWLFRFLIVYLLTVNFSSEENYLCECFSIDSRRPRSGICTYKHGWILSWIVFGIMSRKIH